MRAAKIGRVGALLALMAIPLGACNRGDDNARTGDAPAAVGAESARTAVMAKYYGDPAVRGHDIQVSASGGTVTLSGVVPSEDVRRRARELAQTVDGVQHVEDQLQVSAATQGSGQVDAVGTAGEPDLVEQPGWLTTKIHAQYFANPSVKPWNIDVTTQPGGIVTLSGQVDTEEAKREAVRIARETDGVTEVKDELRVSTATGTTAANVGQPVTGVTDAWLTTKVQARYFQDDLVRARTIDVTTQDGTVTLRGTVTSDEERRQAVALARSTEGVRNLDDQLKVEAQPATDASSTTGGASAAPLPVVKPGPRISDEAIRTRILAKFFLDPSVKRENIDVTAEAGVVTLTGRVTDAASSKEAERIAAETAGVSRVANKIAINQDR